MARLARPSRNSRSRRRVSTTAPASLLERLLEDRVATGERFFAAEAERIACLCQAMAARFGRRGRLLALGSSPQGRSDARHVAVEFVHPVIVGKRALPALAVVRDGGEVRAQLELLAGPDDMVMAFDDEREALAAARARGCLTIAFAPCGAEWVFDPPSSDPFVRQELAETLYHVLWELVHVFFDHQAGSTSGAGASSFLYPFLGEEQGDVGAVLGDVAASVVMKAQEVGELRAQTLFEGGSEVLAAASSLRAAFEAGGKVLAFGNGGSATDAMDAVADFRAAPQGWPPRRALDLTEDSAILTALANDIGTEVLFQRQIIAYGERGDVALALSTSGNSVNIVEALAEARRRGLTTIAMVGYDGGRIAAGRLADYVVVTASQHIPRIQEAQASAYHVLRQLVEVADA
jgi:D-sedoheptulose 7-phosphate isomerase